MTREAVIETIETLSMSSGMWGRILEFLSCLQENDPDKFEEIMTDLESASGPMDLIMKIEC